MSYIYHLHKGLDEVKVSESQKETLLKLLEDGFDIRFKYDSENDNVHEYTYIIDTPDVIDEFNKYIRQAYNLSMPNNVTSITLYFESTRWSSREVNTACLVLIDYEVSNTMQYKLNNQQCCELINFIDVMKLHYEIKTDKALVINELENSLQHDPNEPEIEMGE